MVRWSEEELKEFQARKHERLLANGGPIDGEQADKRFAKHKGKGAGEKVEGRAVSVRQERVVVPDPEYTEKTKKKSKYNAEKTTVDGITFDSKKEAARYEELKLMQSAGEIKYFLRQVPFHLPGGIRYFCDFAVCQKDGTMHYEDVKGMQTDVFKMKKKQVESLYPVTIILI